MKIHRITICQIDALPEFAIRQILCGAYHWVKLG